MPAVLLVTQQQQQQPRPGATPLVIGPPIPSISYQAAVQRRNQLQPRAPTARIPSSFHSSCKRARDELHLPEDYQSRYCSPATPRVHRRRHTLTAPPPTAQKPNHHHPAPAPIHTAAASHLASPTRPDQLNPPPTCPPCGPSSRTSTPSRSARLRPSVFARSTSTASR